MGAAATIEVSFIDEKTGQMLSDKKIEELNKKTEKILDTFDFSSGFYNKYSKVNSYAQMAIYLKEQSEIERIPWFMYSKDHNK